MIRICPGQYPGFEKTSLFQTGPESRSILLVSSRLVEPTYDGEVFNARAKLSLEPRESGRLCYQVSKLEVHYSQEQARVPTRVFVYVAA